MGLNAVKGHAAVRQIRQNMWGGVVERVHRPRAVFAAGETNELMLHGTVRLLLFPGCPRRAPSCRSSLTLSKRVCR